MVMQLECLFSHLTSDGDVVASVQWLQLGHPLDMGHH